VTYISAQQAAVQWGISKRRVQTLCSDQRIPGSVRIGNMWVLPESAQKPDDARKKNDPHDPKPHNNPIREARKSIKALSAIAYKMAQKEIRDASEAKRAVVAILSRELVYHVLSISSAGEDMIISYLDKLFNVGAQMTLDSVEGISCMFRQFLHEHPYCCDDALSWAYQYISKLSLDTGLESTQFFTEKYMITSLVDQCMIENGTGKILDPACGGGNFLLYSLDYLCDSDRRIQDDITPDYINEQLMRLYGYELDNTLAIVSSINLRVKVLLILKDNGFDICVGDFFKYIPNIYYSTEDNIEGSLDIEPGIHNVIRVGTAQVETLGAVLSLPEYIFTNPPFRTVKGMSDSRKLFLNKNYPNAKCDMCNAFIEMALGSLAEYGVCGIVTQSSWMYLDSYVELRRFLLSRYSIVSIIELGSNAFYDISGEKANVVLLLAQKTRPDTNTTIATYSLRNLIQTEKELLLSSAENLNDRLVSLKQLDVASTPGLRLGVASATWTSLLFTQYQHYGQYAIPMQGTSTGDSKALVRYFWECIGDFDWLPVSKGGGYSRWLGLNSYSVKWGRDGEHIRKLPGSAIRNANYFDETQLVFSDTGTSGLNVRLLLSSQIFIASGPGIRVIKGDALSHLAFLNSRFSSFFMRILTPKLTIAAGYISKLPVVEKLLCSEELSSCARICISAKKARLSKRPIYLEFEPFVDIGYPTTLDEQVLLWFLGDMENEWRQLCEESKVDKLVLEAYSLTDSEKEDIDTLVSRHALDFDEDKPLPIMHIDDQISESLSANCILKKSRIDKNHLGCDGVLEYLAHLNSISPRQIYYSLLQNAKMLDNTLKKYRDAYIHNTIISALGYTTHSQIWGLPIKVGEVANKVVEVFPSLSGEHDVIRKWIDLKFEKFHKTAFLDVPVFHVSADGGIIKMVRR
jgi:hypothetical protein